MNSNWLITNIKVPDETGKLIISDKVQLYVYKTDSDFIRTYENDLTILCEGYVIKRIGTNSSISEKKNIPLIKELYNIYGDEFTEFVKGIFTIIIIDGSSFKIFNDQLGISKYFYYSNRKEFVISNNIIKIQQLIKCEYDIDCIAVYMLFNYFIHDNTYFKNIKKSIPASKIVYRGKLLFSNYWDCKQLLADVDISIDYKSVGDKLIQILKQYLKDIEILKPCVTLTGGLDSRLLLALFFRIGIKPDIVSYGNFLSEDVKTAKLIANKYELKFINPDPGFSDHREFNKITDEIIRLGQTLASIYRTNRYQSIKQLINTDKDIDGLFGGYMGGEMIRGLHYEQMIFSEGLNLLWQNGLSKDVLIRFYDNNHVNYKDFNFNNIINLISESNLIPEKGQEKDAEYNVIFNIATYLHHSQDINLYNRLGVPSYPIFIDLDYLKCIFASQYSFLFRNNLTKNQFERINIQEFHCNMINLLNPDLAKINFNYGYSADLYLQSRLLYVLKRVFIKIFRKINMPLFIYGDWYISFLLEILSEGKVGALRNVFDFNKIVGLLNKNEFKEQSESTFLLFTKAVNMVLISKIYGQGD